MHMPNFSSDHIQSSEGKENRKVTQKCKAHVSFCKSKKKVKKRLAREVNGQVLAKGKRKRTIKEGQKNEMQVYLPALNF